MSYPAAYRTRRARQERGGFQNPANDNQRTPRFRPPGRLYPVPTPANDNRRSLLRYTAGFRRAPWPLIQGALYAADAYLVWRNWGIAGAELPGWSTDGYVLEKYCNGQSGPGVSGSYVMQSEGWPMCGLVITHPNGTDEGDIWTTNPRPINFWTFDPTSPHPISDAPRGVGVQHWTRVQESGLPVFTPGKIVTLPYDFPNMDPVRWLDPLPVPGLVEPLPVHTPFRLIPYRRRNPWLHEQSTRGSFAPPDERRTDEDTVGSTEEKDRRRRKRDPNPRRRRRRNKERKFRDNKITRFLRFVLRQLDHATEAMDAVDALWNALPWELRNSLFKKNGYRPLKPHERARAVYDFFNKVDMDQAILNLLANHLTDAMIGRTGAFLRHQGLTPDRLAGHALDLQFPGLKIIHTRRAAPTAYWDERFNRLVIEMPSRGSNVPYRLKDRK